jgi:RHS repeat-associated protein
MALVDSATGTTAANYEYGPFGEPLRATGPAAAANPFRFSTKYTDAETGLLYYGYRYYSPSIKRWLSRDPLGERGGANLYTYVENDPINGIDPWGLDTYKVNRDLARFGDSSASRWNPVTHTFTLVTNPDGSIAHTYSWGNDANLKGWNIDQPLDMKTGREALDNGKAEKVGDKSLDPFVQKAFDEMNKKENEHSNWIVSNNCKTETNKLVDRAKQLLNAGK